MTQGSRIPLNVLRARLGHVAVAIHGSSSGQMLDRASDALADSSFLEFRLDYLAKPAAALKELAQFLALHPLVTAIATCRRKASGGNFTGSAENEVEVLFAAAQAGFHIIDLAVETAEQLQPAPLDKLRSGGAALLVSYHDFKATGDLDSVFERLRPFAPDFYKIVTTAQSLSDNVAMMQFLDRAADRAPVVGICMGERGLLSRVLGLRAGSAFTFASATENEATAPGQVTARTMYDSYRLDHIDRATRIYGVAGNPVSHSLSPLMQNTAFRRETVNAVYLPLQTTDLKDLLTLVNQVPISGLSVTMPLKQEILPHLARTDPASQRIGAVNTLVRSQDGKLYGFNTDMPAILRPIERRLKIESARVLVLGAGGAARAAVFGLADRGAEVFIANRTSETAQKLARAAGAKTVKPEQLSKMQFDVIVNATPSGMHGVKPASPLSANELNASLVFDMVYNPMDTPLLRMARQKGLQVITGVEMFVHQGARQFEIWTGKPAPEEEMLRVLLHALRQRNPQPEAEEPKPITTRPAAQTPPEQPVAAKPIPAPAKSSAVKTTAIAPKAVVPQVAKPVAKPAVKPAVKPAAKPQPAKPASKPPVPTAKKPVLPARAAAKPVKAVATKVAAKKAAPPVPGKKAAAKPAPGKKAPGKKQVVPTAKKTAAKPAPPAKKTAKPIPLKKPVGKQPTGKGKPSGKKR